MCNRTKPILHGCRWKGLEPKFGTSGCQRRNNTSHIIANQNKSCNLGMCFNDTAERCLSVGRNSICLVEDNDLEGRIRVFFRVFPIRRLLFLLEEVGFGGSRVADGETSKVLDFIAHDANATFVRGIEFQDASVHLRRMPQLLTKRQRHRGLSGPGRPIKQQVRHPIGFHSILKRRYHLRLMRYLLQRSGPIPFNPRRRSRCL
mmetsp:Transcript_2503/g.4540  ORF Transcript_2503/g.4540 Transcript_2503/m.4540 type:complete len:203 (-) Transcript_2503:136-744(-)